MECHFEISQKVRKDPTALCSGTKSTGNLAQGTWAEKRSG